MVLTINKTITWNTGLAAARVRLKNKKNKKPQATSAKRQAYRVSRAEEWCTTPVQLLTLQASSNKRLTIEEIKNAVDIVIGDDGFRSKEVIEVLKYEQKNGSIDKQYEKEAQEEKDFKRAFPEADLGLEYEIEEN